MRETLIIKFKVEGNVRFLSHQEMLRLWHRALIRSAVNLAFSEGFNPHPRISLALPRGVGLESDDELAAVLIDSPDEQTAGQPMDQRIAAQLPKGITILSTACVPGRKSFHASAATYIIAVSQTEMLENAISDINARLERKEPIVVTRRLDDSGHTKDINVGEYIESLEPSADGVRVRCRITGGGSVRFDEIAEVLAIKISSLDVPIKRTAVAWN